MDLKNYYYTENGEPIDFDNSEMRENRKNYEDALKEHNPHTEDKTSYHEMEEFQQHKVRELEQEKLILSELHDDQSIELNELQIAHLKLEEQFKEITQLRQLLDQAAIVVAIDKNSKIVHVNKKFIEISKYSEDELVGQTHPMLKSGLHDARFYQDIFTTIFSGYIWSGEIKDRTKNGSIYCIKYVIIPFFKDDIIMKYVFVGMDTSKEKELQEKLINSQRLAAIGELSARIAHDIRNPLSVIQNTLELMKQKDPSVINSYQLYFNMINRAVERITHQVDDVLNYVKPKSLSLKEENIRKILNSVIEKIAIPDDMIINPIKDDVFIVCDIMKIEIVFVNIIMNAIQAMKKNGIIDISYTDDKENIIIKVRDSGCGISDDNLPKIFDPLFTTKQTGTGLGLASCKNIVEQHGGEIHVESKVGHGSVFIVALPKKPNNMYLEE